MASGALFASRRGEGAGALVLLHGFGASHRLWQEVIAALPPERPVIAFDLPGHAGSLGVEARGSRAMAEAVVANLPPGTVHLAGHSMGGAVATLIALAVPDRIASLTLMAPGGFGPQINQRLLRRYATARRRDALEPVLEAMFGFANPVPDWLVADLLAMRADERQVAILARLAERMARGGVQGVIERERLGGLSMAVKVLWGTLDGVLPVAHAESLPPHFALHRLDGAGHMLPAECPAEIARLLTEQMR